MRPELALVVLPPLGWLLWTWGGFNWKPARRFVWPCLVATMAHAFGVSWVRCALTGVAMILTLSEGYGDDSKLLKLLKKKWLVWIVCGLAYGVSTVLLGLNVWSVVTAVSFALGIALSNTWLPAWTQKYVEGFTGLFQGLSVAKQLSGV